MSACAIHDCGCDKSACCFTCALPRCQYDAPAARLPYGFTQRTVELMPLILARAAEGKPQYAIAAELKVSRATVQRVVSG